MLFPVYTPDMKARADQAAKAQEAEHEAARLANDPARALAALKAYGVAVDAIYEEAVALAKSKEA